jgi:hypothetical protein
MPRYTETPYGSKPASGPRIPANAAPIATAPQNSSRPVLVYERDGSRHPAIYHKGQWMKVVSVRDPYTGGTNLWMNGHRQQPDLLDQFMNPLRAQKPGQPPDADES